VDRALLDAHTIAAWRVPNDMTCRDRRAHRHGTFVKLVPDCEIVESLVFQTDDPAFAGRMTIIATLTEVGDGTDVCMSLEGLPPGVRPADKVAALLEAS
jgi:uncharacterized protein YndB with AHSA1/START domain